MKLYTTTAFTLFALMSAAPLLAVPAPAASRVSDLKQAESRLSATAGQTKGGAQQRLLLERQRVRRMIDDLDAGRPVDAQDIDRALNSAEHPF
jgi:hypothetical protein